MSASRYARLSIAALLAFGSGLAHADPGTMDLYILPNGHVRIDSGQELDIPQLKVKIAGFKKQRPQPDLTPRPDKETPFGAVRMVIQTFEDAKYGDHLKFTDQGK